MLHQLRYSEHIQSFLHIFHQEFQKLLVPCYSIRFRISKIYLNDVSIIQARVYRPSSKANCCNELNQYYIFKGKIIKMIIRVVEIELYINI